MIQHVLSIVAFIVVSLSVQGGSHFAINTVHYASIDFIRADPIVPLGILVMIIQGAILTFSFERFVGSHATVKRGIAFSLVLGAFLATYIAIVEPSKYEVPSVMSWMMVEGTASLIQFGVFGALLGFIHKQTSALGRQEPLA